MKIKSAVFAFLAVVAVFFYQTILYGRLPVPADALVGLYHPWRDLYAATNPRGVPFKNFLITDPVRQQIPWRKIAIDQWKSGQIPGWNPYAFSGTSLSGNIQAGIWYPLNILFFVFSFAWGWTLLIILQPVLAGTFLLLYLRNRKFSPAASFLGAIALGFSGFAVSWMTWGTIVHVALWLPLALFAVDRKKTWLLALAFAMMIVAGHTQVALYCIALAVSYALWQKRTSLVALAGLAALLGTIPAWLPVIASALRSGRVFASSWELAEGWFIPARHLVQFIAPDFFGNPATLNYWGTWNYGEMVGYIGVAPILFALSAILRRESAWTKFWIWVGGIALVMAIANPVAQVPFLLGLPVISSLQPTRLLVITVISLVMLAVAGFDDWQKHKRSSLRHPIILAAAVLAVLWAIALFGARFAPDLATNFAIAKRNLILPTGILLAVGVVAAAGFRKFAGVVILALTVFDLLRFGWKFTPFSPREYFFPQTRVITYLQSQPKPFRVMSLDDRLLPPNVSGYFGIESIEGYDPLYSLRYERFFTVLIRGNADISPLGFNRILTLHDVTSPILPLLNVKYVLSLADVDSPVLRLVMREGETRLYEHTAFRPRVYLAENIRTASSGDDATTFAEVLSDEKSAIVQPAVDVLSTPLLSSEGVVITRYTDNAIALAVRAVNPRLLILQTPYEQGWRARVNGEAAGIVRVNYLFFGVVVATGESTVEFVHTP